MPLSLLCPRALPCPKGAGENRLRSQNEGSEIGGRGNPRHRDLPPSGVPPGLEKKLGPKGSSN